MKAAKQLGPEWTMMKAFELGVPEIQDWIKIELSGKVFFLIT
jgi:hypothetical protein